MTYTVSGGTLNPTHSLTHSRTVGWTDGHVHVAALSVNIFACFFSCSAGCW